MVRRLPTGRSLTKQVVAESRIEPEPSSGQVVFAGIREYAGRYENLYWIACHGMPRYNNQVQPLL